MYIWTDIKDRHIDYVGIYVHKRTRKHCMINTSGTPIRKQRTHALVFAPPLHPKLPVAAVSCPRSAVPHTSTPQLPSIMP